MKCGSEFCVLQHALVTAAALIMGGIWSLALPAAVAGQVQALERAISINSLRIIRRGETATIADAEDRDKITTILEYMRRE